MVLKRYAALKLSSTCSCTRTRHAAITRNLYSWSNYKSWADKMRHDWQTEDSKG